MKLLYLFFLFAIRNYPIIFNLKNKIDYYHLSIPFLYLTIYNPSLKITYCINPLIRSTFISTTLVLQSNIFPIFQCQSPYSEYLHFYPASLKLAIYAALRTRFCTSISIVSYFYPFFPVFLS